MKAEVESGSVPICFVADGKLSPGSLQNAEGVGKLNIVGKNARVLLGVKGIGFGVARRTQKMMAIIPIVMEIGALQQRGRLVTDVLLR